MRHWTSCRSASAAAFLALAVTLLGSSAATAAGAAAAKRVVARVNAETITAADIERAAKDAPDTPRPKLIQGLVNDSLVVQEARRLKIDQSDSYLRAVRHWRQDKAVGLIGIDSLRRRVAKAGEKQLTYKEFYPTWNTVYAALPDAEKAAVDAEVDARVQALKDAVKAMIDAENLRKYTVLVDLDSDATRKVVAAKTTWGPITLGDLIAAEPKSANHTAQTPDAVLRMWQLIARELAGRNHVLQTAETAGFFAIPAVQEEEARVRRLILRDTFLDQYYNERITNEALLAKIDQQIAAWTTTYAIAVEEIRLKAMTRLEVDKVAAAWKDGKSLPAGIKAESLAMSLAWPRYSADQKRLLMSQSWGTYPPPLREGDGFVLILLLAPSAPPNSSLEALADPLLQEDLYRELVEKLTRSASIKVD